jgi:hypothetical protein
LTADVSLLRHGAIAIGVYAQERPFFFHLPKSSSYGLARGIDHLDGRADRRLQEGVRGALGNDDMQAAHAAWQRGRAGHARRAARGRAASEGA